MFSVFCRKSFPAWFVAIHVWFWDRSIVAFGQFSFDQVDPKEGISRIFSYNQLFNNLGSVVGPMMGSAVAAHMGYDWVFYLSSGLVLFNLIWSLTNFRNYLKVRDV